MPICNKTNLVLNIGERRNFLQRISDGQPIVTIMAKTVWATALGVYFGAVYVMSKTCGFQLYYILLGIYGVYIVRKK